MAFVNLTRDDYLNIQDKLDYAIEMEEKLNKKKKKIDIDAINYWQGKIKGLQEALNYIDGAYSRDRRE